MGKDGLSASRTNQPWQYVFHELCVTRGEPAALRSCFDKLPFFKMQLLATRLLADLVYFNPVPPDLHRTMAGPIGSTRTPPPMNRHCFSGHHKLPYATRLAIAAGF